MVRLLLSVMVFAAFLLTSVAAVGPGSAAGPVLSGAGHNVKVPVLLDGSALYQPDEFTALYDRLAGQVTFNFVVLAGEENLLYAFTSVELMRAYLTGRGIQPPSLAASGPSSRTAVSPAAPLQVCAPNEFWSYFYDGVDCGSPLVAYSPGSSENDLGNVGFNDRISSVSCSYNSGVTWCVLFEHILFGGAVIEIERSVIVKDLGIYGWDNRASSLVIETSN